MTAGGALVGVKALDELPRAANVPPTAVRVNQGVQKGYKGRACGIYTGRRADMAASCRTA